MSNKCRVKGCDNIKVQEREIYGFSRLEKYCKKHYEEFYWQEVLPKQ